MVPSEETNISEFSQYQKSNKALFNIYAVLEYLIEKTDGCKNNVICNKSKMNIFHQVFQHLQYCHLKP